MFECVEGRTKGGRWSLAILEAHLMSLRLRRAKIAARVVKKSLRNGLNYVPDLIQDI